MSLRRTSSSKKNVVWDEDNLRENEEIQKDYQHVRISEPKTPYRPPLPADSLEEEMRPLQLDEDAVASALTSRREPMTAFDYVMSNGGAGFEPPQAAAATGPSSSSGPSQQQQQQAAAAATAAAAAAPAAAAPRSTTSSEHAEQYDGDEDDTEEDVVGDKRSEPCHSFTSSGSGEGGVEKRRKFEAMRRQHYNMRDALVKAKKLLSEDEDAAVVDEDDDEEEHEGDEDDTAACRANGTASGSSSQAPHAAAAGEPGGSS